MLFNFIHFTGDRFYFHNLNNFQSILIHLQQKKINFQSLILQYTRWVCLFVLLHVHQNTYLKSTV